MTNYQKSMALNTVSIYLFLFSLPLIVEAAKYTHYSCSNTTYAPSSPYQLAIFELLENFSSTPPQSKYREASLNSTTGELIEALYQCRGDVSLAACQSCVVSATISVLQVCPAGKAAVIVYEHCLLRYSNEPIFSIITFEPYKIFINSSTTQVKDQPAFRQAVGYALNQTVLGAISAPNWGFMAKETSTYKNFSFTDKIYTMAQCTGDLTKNNCTACLVAGSSLYTSYWGSSVGGYLSIPSCFFRFEIYEFYNVTGAALATASKSPPMESPLMSPAVEPSASPVGSPSPAVEPSASPVGSPSPAVEPSASPVGRPSPAVEPSASPVGSPSPAVEPSASPVGSPSPKGSAPAPSMAAALQPLQPVVPSTRSTTLASRNSGNGSKGRADLLTILVLSSLFL